MLIQNATKELIPGGIFVFIELGKRRTIRRRPMVFKHHNTRFSLQYFNILPVPESQAMVFGHTHANTDAACWPLILASLQMLNAGVDINCYSPVSFEEMEANNERFKKSLLQKSVETTDRPENEKEGFVCIGAHKSCLGYENGQGRSYEYRYPQKDIHCPRLPFG